MKKIFHYKRQKEENQENHEDTHVGQEKTSGLEEEDDDILNCRCFSTLRNT